MVAEPKSQEINNKPFENQANNGDIGIILIEKGDIDIWIDYQRYHLSSSALVILLPHQNVKVISSEGCVSTSIYIPMHQVDEQLHNLLLLAQPLEPVHLDFNDRLEIYYLCDILSHYTNSSFIPNYLHQSLLALMISKLDRPFNTGEVEARYFPIAIKFKKMAELYAVDQWRPSQYSEQLNIAEKYLNESVKRVTGKPVTYHLLQKIILEAKHQIIHSKSSIKEVATKMGYEDYAYFCRIFTKWAGISPSEFKKQYQS